MEVMLQVILALLLLTMAVYAQRQIPVYTAGRNKILVTRLILIGVGIAFGLTGAAYMPGQLMKVLTFLIGFGLVHFPAAVVLYVKSKRGEGRS